MIYHLAPESELRAGVGPAFHTPAGLDTDGFVHCAARDSVVPVANDYFGDLPERLIVLEIDPALLSSETRYESAAPIEGRGDSHLETATEFPHVYGPIDREAVSGVAVLEKTRDGFVWPRAFVSVARFLSESDA